MVGTIRIKHDATRWELHASMVHQRLLGVREEEDSAPLLRGRRMSDAGQRLPTALQPKSMQVDARQLCSKFARACDNQFDLRRSHRSLVLIGIRRTEEHTLRHLPPPLR